MNGAVLFPSPQRHHRIIDRGINRRLVINGLVRPFPPQIERVFFVVHDISRCRGHLSHDGSPSCARPPSRFMVTGSSITKVRRPHVSFRCSSTSLTLAFSGRGNRRHRFVERSFPAAISRRPRSASRSRFIVNSIFCDCRWRQLSLVNFSRTNGSLVIALSVELMSLPALGLFDRRG